MTKKVMVLMLGLLLGGCGMGTPVIKGGVVEVSIESQNKISAVNFQIVAGGTVEIKEFKSNGQVFNLELVNKGSEKLREVGLGTMKMTKDLPSGKIVLGTINYTGTGKVTVKGMKLIGPGVESDKPMEVLQKNIDYQVAD